MDVRVCGYAFCVDDRNKLVLHIVIQDLKTDDSRLIPWKSFSDEEREHLRAQYWWLDAECERSFPSTMELFKQSNEIANLKTRIEVVRRLIAGNTESAEREPNNDDGPEDDERLTSIASWLLDLRTKIRLTQNTLHEIGITSDSIIGRTATQCEQMLISIREITDHITLEFHRLGGKLYSSEPRHK
jgi:hypothetical protein